MDNYNIVKGISDPIHAYIMEPLDAAYRTNDFLAALIECRKRMNVSTPELTTYRVATNMKYIESLYAFKQKMKKRDYRGGCGKLISALNYISFGSERALNAYCVPIILDTLNQELEVLNIE